MGRWEVKEKQARPEANKDGKPRFPGAAFAVPGAEHRDPGIAQAWESPETAGSAEADFR